MEQTYLTFLKKKIPEKSLLHFQSPHRAAFLILPTPHRLMFLLLRGRGLHQRLQVSLLKYADLLFILNSPETHHPTLLQQIPILFMMLMQIMSALMEDLNYKVYKFKIVLLLPIQFFKLKLKHGHHALLTFQGIMQRHNGLLERKHDFIYRRIAVQVGLCY